MKINQPDLKEPPLTAIGHEFDEGYAEQLDPKTGRDLGDIMAGSIELMTVNIVDRSTTVTHEGDMGRLGKSE